jgi:hypothetical protein
LYEERKNAYHQIRLANIRVRLQGLGEIFMEGITLMDVVYFGFEERN